MYHIALIFCDLKLDETYGWWHSFDLHKKLVGESVFNSELSSKNIKKYFLYREFHDELACLLPEQMDLSVHKITNL